MTIQELQQAAQQADEAWQAALGAKFGKRAGDIRYTPAGHAGALKPLHDAFRTAVCVWRNHPDNSMAKGCDCTAPHVSE